MQTVEISKGLSVGLFSASEEYELYKQFIALRYEVFGVEYGWKDITSDNDLQSSMPADFYRNGIYLLAWDSKGDVCGIGRALCVDPKRIDNWSFNRYFPKSEFQYYKNSIGTIMDLAITKNYRGCICEYMGRRMTLGQAVFICLVQQLVVESGVKIIMGHSSLNGAQNFIRKLGAYLIGSIELGEGQKDSMICYGLVLDNNKRFVEMNSPMEELDLPSDNRSEKVIEAFENASTYELTKVMA